MEESIKNDTANEIRIEVEYAPQKPKPILARSRVMNENASMSIQSLQSLKSRVRTQAVKEIVLADSSESSDSEQESPMVNNLINQSKVVFSLESLDKADGAIEPPVLPAEPTKQASGHTIDLGHTRASNGSRSVHRRSHTSSSDRSYSSNPIKRLFYKVTDFIISTYYSNVSFKKESMLLLLLLAPYPLVIGLVEYMKQITINNYYLTLAFEVSLIILAVLSQRAVHFINRRHSDLQTMIHIIQNEATPMSVFKGTQRKRIDRVLEFSGFCFTFLLFLLEITAKKVPLLTEYGYAKTISVSNTPSSILVANNTEVFDVAIGTSYPCQECIGVRQNEALLVPVK